MKKLLALALLSSVALVSAGCNDCKTTCEKAPICEKEVTRTVRKPAKKHCKTDCWYECPTDCVRKDNVE